MGRNKGMERWSKEELEILEDVYVNLSFKESCTEMAKHAVEQLEENGFERTQGAVLRKLEMSFFMSGNIREWTSEEVVALNELYEVHKDHVPIKEIPEIISAELAKRGISRTVGAVRNRISKYIKGNYKNPSRPWTKEEIEMVERLEREYSVQFGRANSVARMIADELNRRGYSRTAYGVKQLLSLNCRNNRRRSRPWTQEDVDLVHWFRQRGCSVSYTASEINRTEEDVEKMLKMRPSRAAEDASSYYNSPMVGRKL